MNRHDRRASKHALTTASYEMPVNGASHSALTGRAFDHLRASLTAHGNVLSEGHEAALYALCGLFTQCAQGVRKGRYAFGLPTGMGKTSAVIAWCRALVELRLDHLSVAVSASKIEALCQMKRDMIAAGIPADRIGLLYADGGKYSLPCTGDGADRQIMLVSHARVRTVAGLDRFNLYRGKPRDLLVYDESLIAADAKGIAARELRAAIASLAVLVERREGSRELLDYLNSGMAQIDEALTTAKLHDAPQIVSVESPTQERMTAFRSLLPRRGSMQPVSTLLDLAGESLRVVPTSEGGAVWYQVAVPRALRNVLVLDASYPIRDLCRADSSILDAQDHLAELQHLGRDAAGRKLTLSGLKSYEHVELRQLRIAGGRDSMERDFARDPWDRRTTKEIVDVVKAVPATEAVLVFVFKARQGGPDFRAVTLAALAQAGIDVHAKLAVGPGGERKDRINVVTWGMETSLNSYAHCSTVVLAGVLHRSTLDLAGVYLGQRDNLRDSVGSDTIRRLVNSEVCHCIYQALSRGACRIMDNGKARPMTGWIIHRDDAIRPVLNSVMPGVRWSEWKSDHGLQVGEVSAAAASAVVDYLDSLPPEVLKVSARKLKAAAGLTTVKEDTMTTVLRAVCQRAPWTHSGRSLARLPRPTN